MKRAKNNYAATRDDGQDSGELLILPDGRILAHNITPALARLLTELDPADEAMRARAASSIATKEPAPSPLPPPALSSPSPSPPSHP